MRMPIRLLPRSALLLGVFPALLLGGTWLVAKSAVDHLLAHDAVMTGRSWTSYLLDNVKDVEEIAKGAKPSVESQAFFDRAQKAGQVFRYVIYDRDGHTRFVSGSENKAQSALRGSTADTNENDANSGKQAEDEDDEDLAIHNPSAARASASGHELINAEDGDSINRPEFFSEAYLPAVTNGKTVAIVETYIDQTEKRTEYRRTLVLLSGALLLLVAAAFGLPGWVLRKRSNEKRLADAHIHFLAHHDSLTGLINRSRLTEELETRLAAHASPGPTLLYIDIDHFKDVNDTLGHDAGDALLVEVAKRLRGAASDQDCVSRIGGDEFILLRVQMANDVEVFADAARICGKLSVPYTLNGHMTNVTVSIGVAIAPAHGDTVATLMKNADLAAYASKTGGRGKVSMFSPSMAKELVDRLALEGAIRDALESESFELYYQPAVRMPDERLVGFEALLRMRDQKGEMVSPSTFIPLAEQMGLIDKIGEWVLREACRTAKNWPSHLTIAVNLSPAQFARKDLAGLIESILVESALDPWRLELEITEGLLMSKSTEVLDELRKLKALGIGIVMDDFGTGYSSLSYLWQFPFDKIKIDRAFMIALDAEDHGNADTIVKTIIALGRSLNVTVTVEGVESERQVEFVTAANCDQIQGFFFGCPMPQDALAGHILKSKISEGRTRSSASVAPPRVAVG
jgi:diguanylate cyclase (GGDEF)-like protein